MSTNRVVVTGYGVTSPIGNTPEEFWNSLHDGKIGIKPITKFDASEIPVFNAGEIQDFPFDKYFVKKDTNRMDTYSLYAIYAAMEALENSGLNMEEEDRNRVGVIVSSGIGGLQELDFFGFLIAQDFAFIYAGFLGGGGQGLLLLRRQGSEQLGIDH